MLTDLLLVLSVSFVLTQVAIFTTTIYLHRCLTHRAVTFAAPVAAVFRLLTWLTTGIRPRQWVAVHRKHHAHTDTDDDPHSPVVLGWWRVQLTNVALYRRAAADPAVVAKYAKDLPATRLDRVLFDHALVGLGLLVAALVLVLGPVAGALAAGVHFVAYLALSGSVNGPGHHFGRRTFAGTSATNLRWLTLLTAGEGLHNHHHAAPTSARFARKWSDLDLGWWVIRAARGVRLAEVRHDDVDALAGRSNRG
ncbi:MAG: acyl-CoA desaturase [Acidimicrobiales bacterium]